MSPRAWVVDRHRPPPELVERLRADGWTLTEGFGLPEEPWELSGHRWSRWGTIEDESELSAPVLAAARGVVVVVGCVDETLRDLVLEDLTRIGEVEVVELGPDPLDVLDAEQRALLSALAAGSSMGAAAAQLYLSTRTAERRLAAARRALGVRTTAEAVALAAG